MWLVGVGVALIPVLIGIKGFVTGRAVIPGRHQSLEVHGRAAIAVSLTFIFVGLFIHCHYFWGLRDRFWKHSQIGKLCAAGGFILSFVWTCWEVLK